MSAPKESKGARGLDSPYCRFPFDYNLRVLGTRLPPIRVEYTDPGAIRDFPAQTQHVWVADFSAQAHHHWITLPAETRLNLSAEKTTPNEADTVRTLAVRYELNKHILPEWGDKSVSAIQPRPVELWLRSLALSPKSKSHVRNMLYMLMDFAMWCGAVELARNPMELVVVKGATKRIRKPRSLTVEQFQKLSAELHQPHRTLALVLRLLRTANLGMSCIAMVRRGLAERQTANRTQHF